MEETVTIEEEVVAVPERQDGFWTNVNKQFRKNRLAVYAFRFILFLILIAVFADFIANEKPLVAKYQGEVYFPVLKDYLVEMDLAEWPEGFQNKEWSQIDYDWAVFPPVPYLPKNIDFANAQSVSPFDEQRVESTRWRHWLGTDELGHDVLAGMIHGTRIALIVGLVSMGIAAFIGILLGSLAGYFGDDKLQVSRIRIILNLIFMFFAFYYAFGMRSYEMKDAAAESLTAGLWEMTVSFLLFLAIMGIPNLLAIPLSRIKVLGRKVRIPMDIIVSRLIEVMVSIPTLFLIISIIAIMKPSVFLVMAVIGLTSWTGIARFIRAELLRVRSLEYIEAANALGYSEVRIIFKHAIPNALSPVLIAVAFGIAAAILIESTLSFLGLGVPPETMTWGSMLSSARQSTSAWWLAIFPGLAIFLTVTVYNLVGEGLTDALDPRLRK